MTVLWFLLMKWNNLFLWNRRCPMASYEIEMDPKRDWWILLRRNYIAVYLATFDISEKFSNKWFVKKIMQTFDISKGFGNPWHLRFFLFYVLWTQILKCVIVRSTWNFYMGIWHVFVFVFISWKIFLNIGGFLGAVKRNN